MVETTQLTFRAKSSESAKSPGVPGVLTLTRSGLKWVPNNPNAAPRLDVNFKTIKSHRSSKEATSKKAMLNLLTDTPVQYFFEFENFPDRDACRNFIGRILPNAPPATSNQPGQTSSSASSLAANQASTSAPSEQLNLSEMERRMKFLQENSELQKLHQQLVMSGVLSEAEFWASRKHTLKTGAQAEKQKTGLKSAMLADIRPTADGRTNKVMFNLTTEIIHQIFAEKPAVHRAFLNSVPSKMSEVDFWTKYCRAEYLYRTKNAAAVAAEAADDEDLAVFVNDDDIIANEFRKKIRKVDPTLDMASDVADDYLSLPGHGIFRDGTKEPVDTRNAQARNKIMRDINRHAAVVLEGRLLEEMKDTMTVAHALARTQQQDAAIEVDDDSQARAERIRTMTQLEDLQGPQGPPPLTLSIQDPRKYFELQASSSTTASSSILDPNEVLQRFRMQIDDCKTHNVRNPIIAPAVASKILNDLTQTISTAKHPLGRTAEKNVLDALPASVRDSLRQHSSTINELLRHFWASYPITSKTLAEKADRLKDAMAKIYTEIQDLKRSVQSEHRHQVSLILQPMFQTLDAAFAHYEAEAQKRAAKKLGNGTDHSNGLIAVK